MTLRGATAMYLIRPRRTPISLELLAFARNSPRPTARLRGYAERRRLIRLPGWTRRLPSGAAVVATSAPSPRRSKAARTVPVLPLTHQRQARLERLGGAGTRRSSLARV